MDPQTRHRLLGGTATILLLSLPVTMRSISRQGTAESSPETQPAEQVFKNIQVLTGMPAANLQGAMSFIASSLNVDCDYCHVQDFGSDRQPAKGRAREMIRMVRQLNQASFQGRDVVNCFTCHQGHPTPVAMAPIGSLPPRPSAGTPGANPPESSLPSAEHVLDRYVQALGGQAALDRVKSRIISTARLSGGSPGSTTELFQKAPGKVLLLEQSPGYNLSVGFNGQQAWAQDSDKSYWGLLNTPQRNAIMRDSELYQGSRLRNGYGQVTVVGRERIGDRETYVVAGTSPEATRERFYFDAETGLLLRRHIEEQTPFGWFPIQADFEDYRPVDGVQLPFVVRWSSAGGAWGIRTSSRVLDVRDNVPIEDARFNKPAVVR